jgi:hypothetical protein
MRIDVPVCKPLVSKYFDGFIVQFAILDVFVELGQAIIESSAQVIPTTLFLVGINTIIL